MKYGVVIYHDKGFRNQLPINENRAIVFYDDDIEELSFLVKSHVIAFRLTPKQFKGGQVFLKSDPSTIIGVISSQGKYKPIQAE